MRWPSEIPEPEPCEPDLGTPEDWKRIEEELGFEGFDPRRREHLWCDIAEIFNACLSDERMGILTFPRKSGHRVMRLLPLPVVG
jgi:hypothetical protein